MTPRNQTTPLPSVYLIIPAYNEQDRIAQTLDAYDAFLSSVSTLDPVHWHIHVVLNGCTDNTQKVVQACARKSNRISHTILTESGKGRAVRRGFTDALAAGAEYVGFVDADMATDPEAFWQLYQQLEVHDGVIASRYMPGAQITPERPWYKRWGSRLIYEPLVRVLLGITYYDYQCGAKLFRTAALAPVLPDLVVNGWAFDIELLHLLHKHGKKIAEVPTRWVDKAGSKISVLSGLNMLKAIFTIARQHAS